MTLEIQVMAYISRSDTNMLWGLIGNYYILWTGGRRGRDHIVVAFTTCAINISCEFWSSSCSGVNDTTLSDKVCQWLAAGWWISSGTNVSSINKTDRQDAIQILLKVVLNTTTVTPLLWTLNIQIWPSSKVNIHNYQINYIKKPDDWYIWYNIHEPQSLIYYW